ncbi:bifunctional folylpolyglutamate synthase/dihydrofolate synthase [Streptacidiphilus jiangxiensis]|uniref:tetrahydrofolate synthase n=1 Tax=Streptacidiphilus jiangxiensis TaxID=235985 RepID=A0A1H7VPD7_STRJI|nr:Mur ligase family protein [Streptacidiphilus jiangxiensis]SEM10894.1 dihydrofolate synthase / folylpolyglutamate synthase [Streptacidiphilus jiangxiensis]
MTTSSITPDLLYDAVAAISRPRRMDEEMDADRVNRLMAVLGDPQERLRVVHVGGTAGKGSTSRMIAAMLRAGGYRVGLHTKPHLHSLTERFLVDGVPIDADELLDRTRDLGERLGDIGPTWFEAVSGLALRYFADCDVDVAVVEVGMGGSTDATNVVHPWVSVITNVGDDHVDLLGGTLREVAREKAGIVKPGCTAISGVTQPDLAEVIRERAAAVGAGVREAGVDIHVTEAQVDHEGARWSLRIGDEEFAGLRLRAVGRHQVDNAALAVAAVRALVPYGIDVPEERWRAALAKVQIPGRLEAVGTNPLVLMDGAHCPPKLDALAAALEEAFDHYRPRVGVVALSKAQDVANSLRGLAGRLTSVVATTYVGRTEFGTAVSRPAEDLAAVLAELDPALEIHVEPDPAKAYEQARLLAGPDGLVCVTGSFVLVGLVRDPELSTEQGELA